MEEEEEDKRTKRLEVEQEKEDEKEKKVLKEEQEVDQEQQRDGRVQTFLRTRRWVSSLCRCRSQ